jgi:hypothetical protein
MITRRALIINKSFFDQGKQNSKYHFDYSKKDEAGEWFTVCGKFTGSWDSEVQELSSSSKKINWENIAGVANNASMTTAREARIKSQELDIVRGGGDPKMTLVQAVTDVSRYPIFNKMIEFFGMEQVTARVNVQMTGQVFNYHIDAFPHYADADLSQLRRVIVCLEDWVPGHFYIYGTHNYSHWKAGEFHIFKWQDVPHGTANASLQPRTSLIITGLVTEKTNQILNSQYQEYAI